MKKKILAVLISACLIAVCAAVFAACGEDETVKPNYSYYTFDIYGEGLVLSVTNRSTLPHGDLTLPTQSYYYPDEVGGEVKLHDTPRPVVRIADGAFAGCNLLTSVTIGDSYLELGEGCFKMCTKLKTVNFPAVKKSDEAKEIAIPAETFYDCYELTAITGNPVVTAVGDRAFYSCKALSTMEFQYKDGFTIGDEAFFYTVSLHNFDASKAGKIGTDAFNGSAYQPE